MKHPLTLTAVEREALWRIVHDYQQRYHQDAQLDTFLEVAGCLVTVQQLLDRLAGKHPRRDATPDDERLWWKR